MSTAVKFNNSSTLAQATRSGVSGTLYFPTDSTSIVLNHKEYGVCNCGSTYETLNSSDAWNPEYTVHYKDFTTTGDPTLTQGFRGTVVEGTVHTAIIVNSSSSSMYLTFTSSSLSIEGAIYASGSAVNKSTSTSVSVTIESGKWLHITAVRCGDNMFMTFD